MTSEQNIVGPKDQRPYPRPPWLKIMEHGSAGEARTKAFLLDRFWVLERSVDVDGADFLVQRPNTEIRFTDPVPPRIAVVQSKYFQSRSTTHYIPSAYVLDSSGLPLEGFFAMLQLGTEDKASMYLLSAKDIQNSTFLTQDEGRPRYVLGRKCLDKNFEVISRTAALDRIEASLSHQNLNQVSKLFDLVQIPRPVLSAQDIDPEWTLPLPVNILGACLEIKNAHRH